MSPFRGSAAFTESWQNFDFALDDGVATVTFSRPDKLNALTFDVYADLRDLLGELPHRGDARVLVLTGEGRGFCSGGDVEEIIGELQRMSAGELLDFTRMSGAVVKAMRTAPLPIVAAVNGVAAGAGSVLALASDFRLLARSAKFSFLFTRGRPGRSGHGRRVPAAETDRARARDRVARPRRRGQCRPSVRDRPGDARRRRRRSSGRGERAGPQARRRPGARPRDDEDPAQPRERHEPRRTRSRWRRSPRRC